MHPPFCVFSNSSKDNILSIDEWKDVLSEEKARCERDETVRRSQSSSRKPKLQQDELRSWRFERFLMLIGYWSQSMWNAQRPKDWNLVLLFLRQIVQSAAVCGTGKALVCSTGAFYFRSGPAVEDPGALAHLLGVWWDNLVHSGLRWKLASCNRAQLEVMVAMPQESSTLQYPCNAILWSMLPEVSLQLHL